MQIPWIHYGPYVSDNLNNEWHKAKAANLCGICGIVYLGVYRTDLTEKTQYVTMFRKRIVEWEKLLGINLYIKIPDDTSPEKIEKLKIAIKAYITGRN